jgi:hypothetical protein
MTAKVSEEAFLRALDLPAEFDAPSTLAAWADWLEEQGRTHRSRAVRYLLKTGEVPAEAARGGGRYFFWRHHAALDLPLVLLGHNYAGECRSWRSRAEAYRGVVGVLEGLAVLVGGLQA